MERNHISAAANISMATNSAAVSELKSHLGFWLRVVSNDVSHRFAQRLAGSGVTVAEWVILREMFETDVTSPSALADVIGLTRGAVSKLVDRLKEKKLLTRVEAAGDRRFQDVSLTAAGRALVPELAALADTNDLEFFAALSPEERAGLASMLKKLAQANRLNRIPVE